MCMPTPHSTGTHRKAAKNCELAGFLHQLEGYCGRCESSMHIFWQCCTVWNILLVCMHAHAAHRLARNGILAALGGSSKVVL